MNKTTDSSDTKQKNVLLMTKVAKTFFFFCLFISMLIILSVSSNKTEHVSQTPVDHLSIGQEGYILLPGVDKTDTYSRVCLGKTKEDYDAFMKALRANDVRGIMDIPGSFCVANGTKILLVEESFLLRKVRILNGEMAGSAGWTATEWVVSK